MITYKSYTDGGYYEAYDGAKKVGTLILLLDDEQFEGKAVLQNIKVDPAYQRQGIGTGLLRRALKDYRDLLVDNRLHAETREDDEDGTYLSEDGAHFVNTCFSRGILHKRNMLDKERLPKIIPVESRRSKWERTRAPKYTTRSILEFFKRGEGSASSSEASSKCTLKFE